MASLVIVCVLIAGCSVALVFSGIFLGKLIVDYYRQGKEQSVEVATAVASENKEDNVEEIDLEKMLAALEARAKESEQEEQKEEVFEEIPAQVVEEKPTEVEAAEEIFPALEELPKEEKKPESNTQVIIEVQQNNEPELDYEARLARAKEAFEKLEKDYQKNTKALNKYARTERKKARNERLLNKKAAELASLNLSVYNVKELADVDPEKKAKQEELTTHVAELKAAIVEAEEYLAANLEKHNQEVKLNKYLEKEHARYEEEIKSLEEFLNKKDSDSEE